MHHDDFFAAMDQAQAIMGDVAKVVRAYHEALVAAGFSDDQAFQLAFAYQDVLLHSGAEEE